MSGKKNKKSSRKNRKAVAVHAHAHVVKITAQRSTNAQPAKRPTQTAVTTLPVVACQIVEGRLLTVEAQATEEIRPKEFIRVAIRLAARFPLAGDRTAQFAGLAAAARGVLDAEIAWVRAPRDAKPPKHAFAFPAAATARVIGVSYGTTVRRVPRDLDCWEFVRAEAGAEEPLDDGADADQAMDALQDWVAVQIKEQVGIARGGSAAAVV